MNLIPTLIENLIAERYFQDAEALQAQIAALPCSLEAVCLCACARD